MFIFRRVLNAVFADELDSALGIRLVDAHRPGRPRHAQTALFVVLELVGHLYRLRRSVTEALRIPVIIRLTFGDEVLFDGNPGAGEQADLFRFIVLDRGASTERIEVVFGDAFLGELGSGLSRRAHFKAREFVRVRTWRRDLVNFASHELQFGVLVGRATVVVQRDPTIEIGYLFVAGHREDVVRAPAHIAGEIGCFDFLCGGATIVESPDQSWPAVEISGQLRETVRIGIHAITDYVSNFPDWAIVIGEKGSFGFDPFGRARILFRADQGDFLADIFLQEFLGIEQIIFVVLLDHAQFGVVGQRTKVDRGRVDRRGHVFKAQREDSRGEAYLTDVADQCDI